MPASLINYSVTVTGRQRSARSSATTGDRQRRPRAARRERRDVFLPAERGHGEVPVYDDARFTAGTSVEGPAIIDEVDTTIYVPPGTTAERDQFMNYVLTR